MTSPDHAQYRAQLQQWLVSHWADPQFRKTARKHLGSLMVLWHLDLEPVRPILMEGYAPSPRGGKPRDPVAMLRSLLLMVLAGLTSINKWVPEARSCDWLTVLAGFGPDDFPGVGTLYDFLHRLHDGPVRGGCEHVVPPSVDQRRRSRTERPPRKKKEAAATRATKERRGVAARTKKARQAEQERQRVVKREVGVTAKLAKELLATADQPLPETLETRLGRLLLHVAVVPSAERGLLGNLTQLILAGDGSSLVTGARPNGRRTCSCPKTTRCDCSRRFTDPDAAWGYDSYRDAYFFGHRFYEVAASVSGHDLPVALGLGPGNETDFTLGLKTLDRARKLLGETGHRIGIFVADAGHDAEPVYRYSSHHGIKPVIPLAQDAPAQLADRGIRLSPRGGPLCPGGAEMAPWGTASRRRQLFLCPAKARKHQRCPRAPKHDPSWVCRPDQAWGPSVTTRLDDDPRYLPPIPRTTARYQALMNLRTGCERSNSVKKEVFQLEAARHRRSSFWRIRLTLMAILQHARTWVADKDADRFLADLVGDATTAAA